MIGQESCQHCNRGRLHPVMRAAIRYLEDMLGCQLRSNSVCRCAEHNAATPGAAVNSMHITKDNDGNADPDGFGGAVDIWSEQRTMSEVYWAVLEILLFFHGGIGLYFTERGWFIHLDKRGYKYRFAYDHGKRIPFDEALEKMAQDELPYADKE